MIRTLHPIAAVAGLAVLAGTALAKLPPPTEEAKAKAAETAARTAWSNKVADYQLCKSMDKVAARYHADLKKAGKEPKPVATAACTDPGPFVPPESKPLEAAGAHSPPATATAPPSTVTPAAQAQAPAKKP